jgi:hypothetical protein
MTQAANGAHKSRPAKPIFSADEQKLLKKILDQNPPIVELSAGDLNVDLSYQDRPRDRIVTQIVNHFSPAFLGVLKIAQRPDGTYWVCDGATRVQALLARGDKERLVRCEVFQTEGQRQEALLFAFFNSKRSKEPTKLITNLQAYSVAGTDKGFGAAIEHCGFSLTKGRRQLHGPSYVMQAWQLDGDGTAMKKALFTLKEAWRDLYPVHGYMVKGVALLYHTQRRSIDEQLRRVLQRTPPEEIMDRVTRRYAAAGAKRSRIHPDDKPHLVARILADAINRNPGKSGTIDINKLAQADQHAGA